MHPALPFGLGCLLLALDQLCALPENSVAHGAREFVRLRARDVAYTVTFVLCLPVFAVCGFVLTVSKRVVASAKLYLQL